MDNAEAVKIAQSCLDGETTPLAAGRNLCWLVGPPNPIWDEMGCAHGPLSSFYVAADEADRVYFLGSDVERWHPEVKERKRVELENALDPGVASDDFGHRQFPPQPVAALERLSGKPAR